MTEFITNNLMIFKSHNSTSYTLYCTLINPFSSSIEHKKRLKHLHTLSEILKIKFIIRQLQKHK